MVAATKPFVLVVGASGRTGNVIINGLLRAGNVRVGATTRPASASKPRVAEFKSRGVEIRTTDLTSDTPEQLEQLLAGVDILISAVDAESIFAQRPLFAAAKKAGVKRVVPCDFGTIGPRGPMWLQDQKLDIREYIIELGLPHTFVDIGWWMELLFPYPVDHKVPDPLNFLDNFYKSFGDGNAKNIVTSLENVGDYLPRIILDERTLNKAVLVWAEETTRNAVWDLAVQITGDKRLYDKREVVPAEQLAVFAAGARAQDEATGKGIPTTMTAFLEYQISMHVREDNTLEKAWKEGSLDAKTLYPDLHPTSLKEYAEEFYRNPKPIPS